MLVFHLAPVLFAELHLYMCERSNRTLHLDGVNGGIGHGLDLPSQDEFDVPIHLLLTRSQSKENKKLLTNRNKYKHIHYSQNFDFLPQKVDSATPALFYELSFRLVRFRLPNGTYETVITNLDPESFPSIELKQLYALRWGIENSFRQLKHTVGLLHFHAKKAEFIQQEVFARLHICKNCRIRKDQAVLYEKLAKDLAVRTRGADLPGRIGVINLAIKISGFDGVLLRINNRQMCIATEKFA